MMKDQSNKLSLHTFKDGVVNVCGSDQQRKAAFKAGQLPLIIDLSADEFVTLQEQYITEVGGVWHLKAALDHPLEVDDLMQLRNEIAKTLGR